MNTINLFIIAIVMLLPVFASGEYCSGSECGGVKIGRNVEQQQQTTPPLASGPGCVASIDVSVVPGSGRFVFLSGTEHSPDYYAVDYQVTVKNTGNSIIYGAIIQIPDAVGSLVGFKNLKLDRTKSDDFSLVISSNGYNAIAPNSVYNNASITYGTSGPGQYPDRFSADIQAQCPSDSIAPVQTSSGCQAATLITAQPNSVRYNSTTGKNTAVYDVLVVNYGGCPIYEVDLSISVPSGASITKFNDFQSKGTTGQYKFAKFRNTADTLDLQNRFMTSLSAEFSSTPIDRFTVQTTSLCTCNSPASFSSPAPANAQCSAIVTAALIPGSGRVYSGGRYNNGIAADYQVFAANYGSCAVSSVTITFAPFQTSYLTNATVNLRATGQDNVYTLDTSALTRSGAISFQSTITDVFAATGYAKYVPITSIVPQCGGTCSTSNDRETTAPTPTPTTKATPSSPPATVSPSSPAPAAQCVGSVNLVQRSGAGGSWSSQGSTYVLFDISVVNQGSCPISAAAFPYYFVQNAVITDSWNVDLQSPQGYGSVKVYSPISPGATYTAAGVIVANFTTYSNHYSGSPVTCSC